MSKTRLGEDHSSTLLSLGNLAFTWKSSSHDAEAIKLLQEYLAKQKETLGPKHPTTLSILKHCWNGKRKRHERLKESENQMRNGKWLTNGN
ncbi:hypothetical protein HAV15_002966 [Penicillium sp. str. |nr:hypothetical protein HAV15_002966 [Penicillium sp. str. \